MRALKSGNRARMKNGLGQIAGCSDCCGPSTPSDRFYIACPCRSFSGFGCAISTAPCIFVDVRSVLSDNPLRTREELEVILTSGGVGEQVPTVIIRNEGICYFLYRVLYHRPDGVQSSIFDIPDGATVIGGDRVIIERRENCEDGCAEVNIGPEYFRAYPCDGCRISAEPIFVCAVAVGQWGIIANPLGGDGTGGLCVDRTIGYSAAQVQEIIIDSNTGIGTGSVIDNPSPLLVWQGGGTVPRLLPAPSCCYSSPVGNCRPVTCLRGIDWRQFGGDNNRWFPLDTCCGTRQGLEYAVDFTFFRSQTQILAPGDIITTTISSTGTDTEQLPDGGTLLTVHMASLIRRTNGQADITDSFDITLTLLPQCCLANHPSMPLMNEFVANEVNVGVPGYYFSTRELRDATAYLARRLAWDTSPWGGLFQLGTIDDDPGSTFTSSGNSTGDDRCGFFTFRHAESILFGNGGRTDVAISLDVTVLRDQTYPCSFDGTCGPDGWAMGVLGLLPP